MPGFKLPNGADLTPEQIGIINLPTTKSYVIQGAPGTGKTVMAIYRAGQIPKSKKVLVLVYNRPLMEFLRVGLTGKGYNHCEISTIHSWCNDFWNKHFPYDNGVPKLSDAKADYDFVSIGARLKSQRKKFYDHIILDEAQDCPTALLEGLASIAGNITCFIDPNQKVSDTQNAGTVEALEVLCQNSPFELTINFRNTIEIRNVSALYCGPDNEPAEAFHHGPKPELIQCKSNGGGFDFADQTQKMIQLIENNLHLEIGIIVNNKSLHKTYDEIKNGLESHGILLQGRTQVYKPMAKITNLDFSKGGVKIFSYGVMKGLEFDMVILPGFNYVLSCDDDEIDRNRIYVATSRPITKLYMLYFTKHIGKKSIDTMQPLLAHPHLVSWK